MISLSNKIALVTGSGSGIGQAIALCFAEAGALVFASDCDAEAANQTASLISEKGHRATSLTLDVGNEQACKDAVDQILGAAGRCDVLVNNAGVGHVGTILSTNPSDLERLWRINVMGVYYLSRCVLPGMIRQMSGSIVNIASIAGVMGMESRFAYTTSKHAVVGMTRAMALDHATAGVRVNCICPGRVRTPFVDAMLRQYENPDDYLRQLEAPHAMKRMAHPSEIATAALYLASDAASFVTGSAMTVDGGYTTGK
jgi:NAD(P)-dependent dehydrogenase (short-subunit alcohol dehydrogenase family)